MTTSEVTLIPLRHLRVLPNNPRTVTQAKLNQLCDSIRENGFYAHRALAVEPIPGTPDYYVLDGNQRKKPKGKNEHALGSAAFTKATAD